MCKCARARESQHRDKSPLLSAVPLVHSALMRPSQLQETSIAGKCHGMSSPTSLSVQMAPCIMHRVAHEEQWHITCLFQR